MWDACTGKATLAEIASATGVDEQIVTSAVDQLLLVNLLEFRPGFDRRKFLRRSAGVAAVPVIESVVASAAAQARSPSITMVSRYAVPHTYV